jgi:D-alanine-D-alanine ligase-like ATP-grasp enzyme
MTSMLPTKIHYTTVTNEAGIEAGYSADELGEFDHVDDLILFDNALRQIGVEPIRLSTGENLLRELLDYRPPLLWNLNSGLSGLCRESQIPSLCEMLGIPLVGPGPWTAFLTQDKTLTCQWLKLQDCPVISPEGVVVRTAADLDRPALMSLQGPWMTKPNNEDSSRGVDAGAVCQTRKELISRTMITLDRWGPVRVERFVPGFDISANLSCDEYGRLVALEPVMIESEVGVDTGAMKNRLPGAPARARNPLASFSKDLRNFVMSQTPRLGQMLRFRHYARFDLRFNPMDDTLYFLEANICPSFEPDDDFAYGASLAGISFEDLLRRTLVAAWSDVARNQQSR